MSSITVNTGGAYNSPDENVEIGEVPPFETISTAIRLIGELNGETGSLTIEQALNSVTGLNTGVLSDTELANYYYFGLVQADGNWRINRMSKSDTNTETSATVANNSGFGDLNAAWAAKEGLNYVG